VNTPGAIWALTSVPLGHFLVFVGVNFPSKFAAAASFLWGQSVKGKLFLETLAVSLRVLVIVVLCTARYCASAEYGIG
jgi:hypothetical protein